MAMEDWEPTFQTPKDLMLYSDLIGSLTIVEDNIKDFHKTPAVLTLAKAIASVGRLNDLAEEYLKEANIVVTREQIESALKELKLHKGREGFMFPRIGPKK